MAPLPPASKRAAKALGRALTASVFLIAGAQKLQEVAASLSANGGGGKGGAAPAATATAATIAYASRRLDLFLAWLGAPASVLAALRPHHAILVALVGLGEVAAAAGLVLARPWAPPALLALLVLVTPVAHCFWLLPAGSPSAGLELGQVIKNAAIAGALVLEWVAAAEAEAGMAGGARRGRGAKGATVAVVAAATGRGEEDHDPDALGKDE